MIIRILDKNYFVQQTIPSEKGLVQYVCLNVSEDDGRIYRIVRIPVREVKQELVRYLADLYKADQFHELVQYGNEKDQFHVVVDCGPVKGRSLADRLQTDVLSLAERLSMGENFLKYLIVSSIPLWFAESSMDTEHISFTDALEPALNFELEYLDRFQDAGFRNLQSKLRDVLYEIFRKELDKDKLPEMLSLLNKITQGEYSDLMGIYQDYRKIQLMLADVDEASLEPQNVLWRIWGRLKSILSHSGRLLGYVVYAVAIGYLIWSIWHLLQPTKPKDVYPAIGDETIISSGENGSNTDSSASDDSSLEEMISDEEFFSQQVTNPSEER